MKRAVALMLAAGLLIGAAPARLPQIAGTTLAGAPFRVDPAARQVVLVHFWATWCVPCRVEMPVLDRAIRRHGVQVVGIALDSGASRQKIRDAAGATAGGVGFPLLRVAESGLAARVIPSALPETLVYGRDGSLRARFGAGGRMLDEAALDQILPALLAEK